MSRLLFLDESGHDHKNTPYEVRGGVALSEKHLWNFVRSVATAEKNCFGAFLHEFKTELKGSRLLEERRFGWAGQETEMADEERRMLCRRFLTKGLEKKSPAAREFTAFGQASLLMVKNMFQLLEKYEAVLCLQRHELSGSGGRYLYLLHQLGLSTAARSDGCAGTSRNRRQLQ